MEKQDLKKKLENFWFYHKFKVLFAVFVLIVIIVLAFDMLGSKDEAKFVVVDATNILPRDESEELIADYTNILGIKEDEALFKYEDQFVKSNDDVAEMNNLNDVYDAIEAGNVDILFTLRALEYDREVVGDIDTFMPKDLWDRLVEDKAAVKYLEETSEGEYVETDYYAGILINDAKRFREKYGEQDYNIVIQIPESSESREDAIEFIKYLFDY